MTVVLADIVNLRALSLSFPKSARDVKGELVVKLYDIQVLSSLLQDRDKRMPRELGPSLHPSETRTFFTSETLPEQHFSDEIREVADWNSSTLSLNLKFESARACRNDCNVEDILEDRCPGGCCAQYCRWIWWVSVDFWGATTSASGCYVFFPSFCVLNSRRDGRDSRSYVFVVSSCESRIRILDFDECSCSEISEEKKD